MWSGRWRHHYTCTGVFPDWCFSLLIFLDRERRPPVVIYVHQRTEVFRAEEDYRHGIGSGTDHGLIGWTLHHTLLTSKEMAMALRNFTLNSSRGYRGGYVTEPFRGDAEDDSCFPHAHVAILDVDYSDDDACEPDGVNEFVRYSGFDEVDQL